MQTIDPAKQIRRDWWIAMRSSELDATVALALANNWTIKVAQANLARADDAVAVVRGGLYPHVDVGATALRRKFGANSVGPEASTFAPFSAYAATANFVFEPDLFGGTRRAVEEAQAQAEDRQEELNATQLTVAGATVTLAVQIASTRMQLTTVRNVLNFDEANKAMMLAARAAGVTSDTEVTGAQATLERDRGLLPPLNQQLNAERDALSVLVGRAESDWSTPEFSLERMSLPEDLPLVIPSMLVRARPDIRAAEAQLHEASADIGVAKADLYPRFDLAAAAGASGLFGGPPAAIWTLIGGVRMPIFHGGALSAREREAEDTYQAAFADYQEVVMESFGQVAQILHALANDADAVQAHQSALLSANVALELAKRGVHRGAASVVLLLNAQRLQQLDALELVKAQEQRYEDTVQLFIACGGGVQR